VAEKRIRTLTQALRARVVLVHAGHFVATLGGLMLAPAVVALLAGELDLLPWCAGSALAALGLGLALSRLRAPAGLQRNEALAAPALLFVVAPLFLALPLVGAGIAPLDAFFEAVSGITTTGLSVIPDVETIPRTIVFARAWYQWVGGLAVVVLALLLFVGPGVAVRRLAGGDLEQRDLIGNTRVYARRVLGLYAGLTAAGFVLLWLEGAGAFDGLVYVLAAVSTGGFASHTTSLGALPGLLSRTTVGVLSLLGAFSFGLYSRVGRGHLGQVFTDLDCRALVVAGVVTTAALVLFEWLAGNATSLPDLALTAFSAQSTTGFSTRSIAELSAGSKAALILSMTIGGDFGSTAGGIKIARALILLRVVHLLVLRRSMSEHAVVELRLGRRRVEPRDVEAALALVLLYLAIVFASWLPFLASGYDPLDALFEVTSAMGTVGLSTGVTSAALAPGLKAILCVDMWLGRLEILPLLVLLQPRAWLTSGGRTA
jgi:trk system potassium uptake protein TrkH